MPIHALAKRRAPEAGGAAAALGCLAPVVCCLHLHRAALHILHVPAVVAAQVVLAAGKRGGMGRVSGWAATAAPGTQQPECMTAGTSLHPAGAAARMPPQPGAPDHVVSGQAVADAVQTALAPRVAAADACAVLPHHCGTGGSRCEVRGGGSAMGGGRSKHRQRVPWATGKGGGAWEQQRQRRQRQQRQHRRQAAAGSHLRCSAQWARPPPCAPPPGRSYSSAAVRQGQGNGQGG